MAMSKEMQLFIGAFRESLAKHKADTSLPHGAACCSLGCVITAVDEAEKAMIDGLPEKDPPEPVGPPILVSPDAPAEAVDAAKG